MPPRSGVRLAAGMLVALAALVLVAGALTGADERPARAPQREPRVLGTRPGAAPPVEAAPLRAARRFLAGYLPYSRGRPGPLPGATAALRAELRRGPPGGLRGARPRVASLDLVRREASRAVVIALIDGGAAPYQLPLELRRSRGWRVAAIGH